MPELGTAPVNKYLPPRPKDDWDDTAPLAAFLQPVAREPSGFLKWLDKALDKLPGGAS